MLKIRFARAGRKGRPFYHIVATEHTRPPQSGYQDKLGWYNPLSKECEIDAEAIKTRVQNGAKLSPSVERLLKKQEITI